MLSGIEQLIPGFWRCGNGRYREQTSKEAGAEEIQAEEGALTQKKVGDFPGIVAAEKLFLNSVNEPLYECCASAEIFDVGIGDVLISRRRARDGLIAASIFLVDIFCLGVKNAMFHLMPPFGHEATLVALEMSGGFNRNPSGMCSQLGGGGCGVCGGSGVCS
jgi:hypothetical protein